jgi:hypothetical protein
MGSLRIRKLLAALLMIGVALGMSVAMNGGRVPEVNAQANGAAAQHDFDFLAGSWTVQHRRLRHRLAHGSEWETFAGTCRAWLVLGGQGNVDDNLLEAPAGTYRAVILRTFDPQTNSWSIWWVDARHPHDLDPPVVGGFRDGVGTFFANQTFEGKPIRVRYIWSDISPRSAKWQQAFSADGGKTWETNWIMEFQRRESARP